MWRILLLVVCVGVAGCGDDDNGRQLPNVVEIQPGSGSDNVMILSRVKATIDRDDGDKCRFVMADTTLEVTQDGNVVPGALVFFIDGLRVDFTPTGLFDYATTYDVEVKTACAKTATATFTTDSEPGGSPTIGIGDVCRFDNMAISEPQAIAPILKGFFDDAHILMKIMEFDDEVLRVLGGEGREINDPMAPEGLKVFMEDGFLFPTVGTFRWPFFQTVGSLDIPVELAGDDGSSISLEHFEVSGQLYGASPETEVVGGVMRASSSCDQVCSVQDQELQAVCANRSLICDEAGMLNLVGSFEAPPNNLGAYQEFLTRDPQPGTPGVDVDTTIAVTLSRAVNVSKDGAVTLTVTDSAGNSIDGTTTVAGDGLSATFLPDESLTAGTTYTVLAVALDANEWQFSTAP
ncbi:Ig-like domain-containing protein [Myxococcota bacterium]